MDEELILKMVIDIVATADEDLAKQLNPQTAENLEDCEELLEELMYVANLHLNKLNIKG